MGAAVSARMRSRLPAIGPILAALVCANGCGEDSTSRAASRILSKYREVSGAKPLTAGGMIRLKLLPADGKPRPTGLVEILWEPRRYRECASSAGMTTCRGIESGRAYFTDEDGVTRVVSDPVLRELFTRSYFWRRAWLFEDREHAWLRLGPADGATVSLSLRPEGGDPLLLIFARDGALRSARSPRFRLDFSSERSFRDESDPRRPVAGEVAWVGLPTGPIPQAYAGGERARFRESGEVAFESRGGVLVAPARLEGRPIRLAISGAADGPIRLAPALATRLALSFAPDVFGRSIAGGASLEVAGVDYPSVFVQRSEEMPAGADALAGGCLFREAIVEVDPARGILRLHDPARWVAPDGYYRAVIDDDGDRPVAALYRGSRELRLTVGADTGEAALRLAAESAERVGFSAGEARGLTWGALRLPPLPAQISSEGFFPEWGNDGNLGYPFLLRFHAFVNMPVRWVYLKAVER